MEISHSRTYSKAIGVLVCQVQLVRLGANTEIVEHDIPLGICEVIRIELLLLGSLDLGCILSILVGLIVTGSGSTRDVLEVRNNLLGGFSSG